MVGEGLLGLGLGALALALRLHAPVPEFEAGPVPLTLLTPPVPRGGGCQVEVYVHGRREGAALLQAPDSSCGWLPGQPTQACIGVCLSYRELGKSRS